MSKFLVVGCGGSGAATQAYMLDQLRAHLKQTEGTTVLPKSWQFVAVDVPIKAEAGPDNLPNVEQSGGVYVSTGSNQTYASFDQGLAQTLGSQNAKALGEIATWASRNPGAEQTPIDKGAGQYRGVGRILTIQHLRRIREALVQAVDRLNDVAGNDEAPQVFVVSSMAGGAGASMFLDVCRLLTTVNGIQAGNIAAFMYTPEVFEALPKDSRVGQWPNALAMFGEAVAAQYGAGAEHDARLYQAMGISENIQDTSIGRLIPIGSRMGANGATFGEGTPKGIYRGMGRALAALMTSTSALEDFTRYTMGNRGGKAPDRSLHGWGHPNDPKDDDIPWGSMGYAQLSLGRDRYAEYSAQRLARAAFDRLLNGHVDESRPQTGAEQLEMRLNDNFGFFLTDTGLPEAIAQRQDHAPGCEQWLFGTFGEQANEAVLLMQQQVRLYLPDGEGRNAQEWRALLLNALNHPELARTVRSIVGVGGPAPHDYQGPTRLAYSAVHRFADTLANTVTGELEEQLARYGLAYAEAIVDKLREALNTRLVPYLEQAGRRSAAMDPLATPAGLESILQPLNGRGSVANAQGIVDSVVGAYGDQFGHYFLHAVADQLSSVLDDFSRSALAPLKATLGHVHRDLEAANSAAGTTQKLSDVTTDEPAAWPRDVGNQVPGRFRGSDNEIVISPVDEFGEHYEGQLLATQRSVDPQIRGHEDATRSAVREIILGQWETQGGDKAPNDTLAPQLPADASVGNRMGWVGRDLVTDPYDERNERRTARTADFNARLSPADLLGRARLWIERPHLPFSDFIKVDLRTYLSRNQVDNQRTYDDRVRRLREAFTTAVANARPLAAVDSQMIGRAYYGDAAVDYRLSFSELPFAGMPDVERELEAVLVADKNLDQTTTLQSFHATSTKTQSFAVDSIEVFGSYPNYTPIVFSSLLPHIAEDWASRPGEKGGFWNLRRARPLPAALPLTDAERETMVAGWFVGVLTGRIYIENSGTANAIAFIYDDANQQWTHFPRQLLTPPSKFKATYDWMPAVIESVLLAYADSHNAAGGGMATSMRPYHLLRGLYDSGETHPTTGNVRHPAVSRLAAWLRTGEQPPVGTPTTVPDTLDERHVFAAKFFHAHLTQASTFMPAFAQGFIPGVNTEAKPLADVTDRQVAAEMPLYRDLAPDVVKMAPILLDKLESAKHEAEAPVQQSPTEAPGQFPGLGGLAGGGLL